ncbi:uncharacterized protein Dwil_GK27026 [Drosophila willistoni]|uniref:HMG box domain-containing protein n=1 Tax=Drosophila willistoni TaxID=7260 RepID=A0A0Q9X1P6_DROWI|nr:uncharacterized protein LOC26529028 [Drosophila willistoni]KRF98677.1 uncharacterized protein Dwil_GK27026 [Drosophila willistoni]
MELNPIALIMKNMHKCDSPGFSSFWQHYMLDSTRDVVREWNSLSKSEQEIFSKVPLLTDDECKNNLRSPEKAIRKARKPRKPKVTKSNPAAARLNVTRSSPLRRREMNRYKTSNTYLNFMRSFLIKNKDMEQKAFVDKAAEAWVKMSEDEKKPYRRGVRKLNHNRN